MHFAIYNTPQESLKLNIPLIVYGENSAKEYGGNKKDSTKKVDYDWLSKFTAPMIQKLTIGIQKN